MNYYHSNRGGPKENQKAVLMEGRSQLRLINVNEIGRLLLLLLDMLDMK